jgi:hypothetical protein
VGQGALKRIDGVLGLPEADTVQLAINLDGLNLAAGTDQGTEAVR